MPWTQGQTRPEQKESLGWNLAAKAGEQIPMLLTRSFSKRRKRSNITIRRPQNCSMVNLPLICAVSYIPSWCHDSTATETSHGAGEGPPGGEANLSLQMNTSPSTGFPLLNSYFLKRCQSKGIGNTNIPLVRDRLPPSSFPLNSRIQRTPLIF